MSYKLKKANIKGKKEKDPNKFHLGRNTGTALIIGGALLGLLLIYIILWVTVIGSSSYLKVYNANKVNPYKETYPDAIHVESDKFDELDVDFYCTSFDSKDEHKATFKLFINTNDKTDDLIPLNSSLEHTENTTLSDPRVVYAGICLAANWVGVEQYSSSLSGIRESYVTPKEDSDVTSYTTTISVSLDSDQVFPMKTSNWPVNVKVETPDAYVFLAFYYESNGIYKLQEYVLHYTYKEYTSNDFGNFGITNPAI